MALETIKRAFDAGRWRYLVKGAWRRLGQPRLCPVCRSPDGERVDRKLTYTLLRCAGCEVLYRYPYESPDEMAGFYQTDYQQEGLTTDLPDSTELGRLLATNFKGSDKDVSRLIEDLAAVGLTPPARVLDYGANWGYCVRQLRNAGFDAVGYEISKPRAAFAAKLDVEVRTSLADVRGPFDAVYSGHVLEHVPDPRKSIREQLDLTRDGGFVLLHTPNGSAARRQKHFPAFHRHWGLVHPVLLTERFVGRNFGEHPTFVAAAADGDDPRPLRAWDQRSTVVADTSGGELFAVIRKTARAV